MVKDINWYFTDEDYDVFSKDRKTKNGLAEKEDREVVRQKLLELNKKLLPDDIHINSPIYVPYHSLNNKGLVKCIKPLKLEIDNKYYSNFLLGIMNDKIGISGVDCILNLDVMEGLHV